MANAAGAGGNGADGLNYPPPPAPPPATPGGNGGHGGAILASDTNLALFGCDFHSNRAGDGGIGGQLPTPAASGSPGQGAAVFSTGGTTTVRNCTFANNVAPGATSALASSAADVANTVFYFNTGAGMQTQLAQTNATNVRYTCVQNLGGGLAGPGNISSNPAFVDPDGLDNIAGNLDDNYSLSSSSPCIDRGSNALIPTELTLDILGHPRRSDVRQVVDLGSGSAPVVDMGATEAQGPPACLAWSSVAGAPAARRLSAMAYDSIRHRAVMFGGRSGATTAFADTWERDLDGAWNQATSNIGLPARADHAMAYIADRAFTFSFGGYDGVGTLTNDVLAWNGSGWTTFTVGANRPSARGSHAMAYDSLRRQLVVFGGYDAVGLLGDTWILDVPSATWSQHLPANPHPSPRLGHMIAFDESRGVIVLFGGGSSSGAFGDTWEWDGTAWRQASAGSANDPLPRSYGVFAYDSIRQRIVLHGGFPGGPVMLNDTWEWNGLAWRRLGSTAPRARRLAAGAFDSSRAAVLLIGGNNGSTDLADTWEFAPSSNCCIADVDDGTGTGTPDGGVTIDDLLYYLDQYAQGTTRADLDDGSGTGVPDGGVTIDDLLYFLARYSAGC